MVKREELKRMRELGRPGMSDDELEVIDKIVELAEDEKQQASAATSSGIAGTAIKQTKTDVATDAITKTKQKSRFSKRQRVIMFADRVVGFVLRNTIGRFAGLIGSKLLGKVPEAAKTGSYHDEVSLDTQSSKAEIQTISGVDTEGMDLLEEAISVQLKEDAAISSVETNNSNESEDEALFSTLYEQKN